LARVHEAALGLNLNDPLASQKKRRPIRDFFLGFDSAVDDAVFRLNASLSRFWDGFTVFMDRFHIRGWRRGAVELVSDGATFLVLGGLVMCAFARPAFDLTKVVDWRSAQEFAVIFYDRSGQEIGRRGVLQSDAVPLDEIPENLIKATLATEDRRFYEHWGIDVAGTLRAVLENVRAAGVVQGGSSLTQQLAKNMFLSNERSLERKIKEAFLSIWLEANLTKAEILKLYLDRAYMGGGAFGVDAAARFYFGKSVRDVTLAEAAMLAGLYKAPSKFAPHVNLPAARARAATVLSNLVEAGLMTEGQVFDARRSPATPISRRDDESPDYFLDHAFEEVKELMAQRPGRVLSVRTTIDMALQRKAEGSIESALRQLGTQFNASQGALVSMELDGAIRAMVGGRDYGASQFNRATSAERQTGSAFKPFVYAAAFMRGYTPRTVMADAPISIGNWSPQNYGRSFAGPVTLTTALVRSINTIPVRLSVAIGRQAIIDLAHAMGIESELRPTWALPLGVEGITVLDMATSYGVFPAGGREVLAHTILEVRNGAGALVYSRIRDAEAPKQVLPPQVAADINGILAQVVDWGTGQRAQLDGFRTAGKTGTTQDYRDAWFAGYSGNFSTTVWFGNDDYSPMNRMTGGSLPAMAWADFMRYAHDTVDSKPIFGLQDQPLPRRNQRPSLTANDPDADELPVARSALMTRRTVETLQRIETRLIARPATPDAPRRVSQAP
jgi:penicillin-binding protein 1A